VPFPHTTKTITEVIGGFPETDQARLRRDNAIEWYRLA
jgi:hypothetical protein